MLQHLTIKNYALIESLDIDLQQGFSVITGETGAGKSILLGAIGLLLGQRADSKSIRQGAQKCTIEAQFDLSEYDMQGLFEELDIDFDGQECIIRREVTTAGKSRGFINDTPATVAQLREIGDRLIDIHSQHQNLLLSQEDFQINVLDTLIDNDTLLADYKLLYREYQQLSRQLEEKQQHISRSKNEEEYIRFQLTQLQEAKLQEDEDKELEEEQNTLEHAEDIKSSLAQAVGDLSANDYNLLSMSKAVCHQLDVASRNMPAAEELASRMESCFIELKDINAEAESMLDGIEFNPARLAFIEERLSTIYDLERKHHVETVAELLQVQADLEEQLSGIENGEEDLRELEQAVRQKLGEVEAKAKVLTQKRQEAGQLIEKQMVDALVPLGIPNVRFVVEVSMLPKPGLNGKDHVTFLFSANKNGSLQPVSQVASGGEIARVMLSLKAIISTKKCLPTIIFDEIDTGVSGQIAERMALIMQQMGKDKRQVISITHLPQIASLGQHHYKVYKEDNDQETNSHIVSLTPDQRIEEIAHMLSGSTLSEAAIQNARTLLGYK